MHQSAPAQFIFASIMKLENFTANHNQQQSQSALPLSSTRLHNEARICERGLVAVNISLQSVTRIFEPFSADRRAARA